jgi:hypothetical protein
MPQARNSRAHRVLTLCSALLCSALCPLSRRAAGNYQHCSGLLTDGRRRLGEDFWRRAKRSPNRRPCDGARAPGIHWGRRSSFARSNRPPTDAWPLKKEASPPTGCRQKKAEVLIGQIIHPGSLLRSRKTCITSVPGFLKLIAALQMLETKRDTMPPKKHRNIPL